MKTGVTCLYIPGWGADERSFGAVAAMCPWFSLQTVSWAAVLRGDTMPGISSPRFLVGWSLGGLLALETALDNPGVVAGVIVISGTARLCSAEGYAGVAARDLRAMRTRLQSHRAPVLADFAERCAKPDGTAQTTSDYLEQARQYAAEDLSLGLSAFAEKDLRTRIKDLDAPLLLIHGERDGIVPLSQAEHIAGQVPHARLEVLLNCGHAIPMTASDVVARLITEFVA